MEPELPNFYHVSYLPGKIKKGHMTMIKCWLHGIPPCNIPYKTDLKLKMMKCNKKKLWD